MENNSAAKFKIISQHLLFWIAFVLYHAVSYGWENTDQLTFSLSHAVINASPPVLIITTYFNLYVLMPAFYYREKFGWYILSLLLLVLLNGLLTRLLTHIFILPWEKLHDPVRYTMERKEFFIPVRIIRLSIEAAPVLAVTMVIQLMRRAYRREQTLRSLEQEKFTAEIGLLKAQINPHFFFNTLNTLYGLILQKSAKAAGFVLSLADLMQYMLYEAKVDQVALSKEIEHLENYLHVEQMRFADRLDLSFQYSGDITRKSIAPLILLPFVENTFKHGLANDSGWITIAIKVTGSRLFMKVENSYRQSEPQQARGLGLENVRRRLELIYPQKHELQIHAADELFEVDLKIDL